MTEDEHPAEGDPATWYRRGVELVDRHRPEEAVAMLAKVAELEPDSRAVREALARAQFDARRYAEARDSFAANVAADPTDDYALFGLGLSFARLGDFRAAAEHLSIATAMRPDNNDYAEALRQVRATRRARGEIA